MPGPGVEKYTPSSVEVHADTYLGHEGVRRSIFETEDTGGVPEFFVRVAVAQTVEAAAS